MSEETDLQAVMGFSGFGKTCIPADTEFQRLSLQQVENQP